MKERAKNATRSARPFVSNGPRGPALIHLSHLNAMLRLGHRHGCQHVGEVMRRLGFLNPPPNASP
jgi:hypothetical protein